MAGGAGGGGGRWPSSPALGGAGRAALTLVVAAVATVLVASHFLVVRVNLRVGEVAPQNVYATREVLNRPLTDLLRRQAAARVAPVYVADRSAPGAAQVAVGRIFRAVVRERAAHASARAFRVATGLRLTAAAVAAIEAMTPRRLAALEADARLVVGSVMATGYRSTPASVAAAHSALAVMVGNLGLGAGAASQLVLAAAERAFRPSLVYSAADTMKARRAAMAAVAPAYVVPGDVVVVAGTRVTAAQMTVLRELGLVQGRGNGAAYLGAAVVTLLLLGLVVAYLWRFEPDRLRQGSTVWSLGMPALGVLLIGRLVAPVSGYLVPVSAASILAAILVDARVATLFTVVLGLMTTVALGLDVSATAVDTVAGLAAVVAVADIRDRLAAPRALLYAAVGGLGAGLGFVLLGDVESGVGLAPWVALGWSAAGSLLGVILSFGSLPLFEQFLGVLTPVRLIELANPNQPLLRRLLMEAPGTYHHSVVVANLAEAAAEAVGANGLLARVGAFYHDVGKLRRPFFFVDNQFGAPNPHDRLAPSVSAAIIMAHVKDGVAIAAEAGLPPPVLDLISQHHGTTRVEFFWRKARDEAEAGGGEGPQPQEEAFRYPGPKPASREAAILMLADTSEAAARALPRPTPARIEARVRALIRDRLADGQLDEADLTLRDLDRIAATFTQVLAGVFHSRVPYPDNERGVPDSGEEEAAASGTPPPKAGGGPAARGEG
ncbi:MAG: HDIG domain-containing protein [Firmicutes bacterium]|nr:HDIG domain-containing protein [Bacillota bacterium]